MTRLCGSGLGLTCFLSLSTSAWILIAVGAALVNLAPTQWII